MPKKGLKSVLLASAWWNEDIIRGVAHYAARAGWHLDMQMTLTNEAPEAWRGDGVIVMPSPKIDMSRLLGRASCPVVAMNLSEPQLRLHRLAFDSLAIGALAAKHFLEHAFSSFAWYSHDWAEVEKLRCGSFVDSVTAAGFKCKILAWPKARGTRKNTWHNRQQWLQRQLLKLPKPVAVFSTDDTVAVEVIEACMASDLKVPYEVSVLGCGNVDIFRETTSIPLSTIDVDFAHLTHEACSLLEKLMNGNRIPKTITLLPPGEIVVRRSTDTIVSKNPHVAKALRFMFETFSKSIGIPEITRASGTSKSRLYIAFRRELGEPPSIVLHRIRIDKAKRMLRETETNIRDVSVQCGFGDPVNLYRCFRRVGLHSPQKYRKRYES